ncbi:3340_t:CDS:2, partial [Scutellospora calospora]
QIISEIKKIYRKLILIWHPDKNINNKEESEKKTKEITEAYRIITEYREKFKKTKSKKQKLTQKPKPKKQPKKTKPKQIPKKQPKTEPKSTKQKSTNSKPKAEVDKEILNFLYSLLNSKNEIINSEVISFNSIISFDQIFYYFNDESNITSNDITIKFDLNCLPSYGAERETFYGKNIRTGKDIVVKRYLFNQFDIKRYKTTILTTLVSQFFANQFNNTKVAS